jgi:hypothetical protein
VSKVVLKQFRVDNRLFILDRERGALFRASPRKVFYAENFDAHDPLGSEELWQRVENQMHAVYAAIHAGTALDHEKHIAAFRDLLALHWARSPAIKLASERILGELTDESKAELRQRPDLLGLSYKQRTGLHAVSDAALALENERLHALRPEVLNRQFSERLRLNFATAKEMFGEHEVQLGYVPQNAPDLIIGDAPVILRKDGSSGCGPHQGVAIGDASEIVMPIHPRVLLALGPTRGSTQLGAEDVHRFNGFQVQAFIRWLAARPQGAAEAQMLREVPSTFHRAQMGRGRDSGLSS